MKKFTVLFLMLSWFFCVSASENPLYEKKMVANFGLGYSYRLGEAEGSGAEKSFNEDLRRGLHLKFDFDSYIGDKCGLGLKILRNSYSASDDNIGELKAKVFYIGPDFCFRVLSKVGGFYLNAGFGFLMYSEKFDPNFRLQTYNGLNASGKGSWYSVGSSVDVKYLFNIGKCVALGPSADFLFGGVKNDKSSKEKEVGLSSVNYTINLMLRF